VERNLFIRILCGLTWLIVTIFLGHVVVGGIIGAIAGSEVSTSSLQFSDAYQAGRNAGSEASQKFFTEHGGKVFLAELCLWLALLITGIFPGVSKFKKIS
jgi:hypothetical protein